MENRPEGKVRYIIERTMEGKWDVSEKGFDEPIASFQERNDAIEYAQRLANTRPHSASTTQ